MAAGMSSRFVPLSYEKPKGLFEVKGEILIERQIRQLKDADINDITIVVGYKSELFDYLVAKFGVSIVLNEDYAIYNNTSSVIRVLDKLENTFLCSSDNYFKNNPFKCEEQESFYSALYSEEQTDEYCLSIDVNDYITDVKVGGKQSWYMVGHVFFNELFSNRFAALLEKEYATESTRHEYWEDVYIRHIQDLPMKIKRFKKEEIKEFDSIDELRHFDKSYISDTRSSIIKEICERYKMKEAQLHSFHNIRHVGNFLLFDFKVGNDKFLYDGSCRDKIKRI